MSRSGARSSSSAMTASMSQKNTQAPLDAIVDDVLAYPRDA
jgi:hypothetical protein